MNNKERLFELVRKEDVVLWIGAGFSKYAGYPMGGELAQIIYSNCTKEEKEVIGGNKALQDIANDFVNIRNGSRNQLLELLKENIIYNKPTSTEYHDLLSQIPHIKTIITTNYDTLLEDAYKERGQKIVIDSDVPYIKEDKTSKVKIHGDFTNSDKIVITKDDYTNFYNIDYNTPIWHLIKERIVTKTVVFIGYGMEDSNISAIFNKVSDTLGSNKKEMFFIAPNLPSLKQNELVRKGICYVNSTGEEFISGLIENINNNLLFDVERKYVSLDTANKYTVLNSGMYVGVKPVAGGNIIESLKPITGKALNQIFKFNLNDKNFSEKIMNSSITDEIVIPAELIMNPQMVINGIKHPLSDRLKEITLLPIPEKTFINFYFNDTDEFTDIPVDFYKGKGELKLKCRLKAGILTVLITLDTEKDEMKFSITSEHKDNGKLGRINDEILFYKLTLKLFEGNKMKLVTGNNFSISLDIPQMEFDKAIIRRLEYLERLKIIEKHYSVIFDNLVKITTADYKNVDLIYKNIVHNNILDNSEDGTISIETYNRSGRKDYKKDILKKDSFEAVNDKKQIANLHGHKLDIGYQYIKIEEPIYLNKERYISGKDKRLHVSCKANKCIVCFIESIE